MRAARLRAYTATSTAGKDMKLLRSINAMSPAKKVLGTGLGLGTLGLTYAAHRAMEEEAEKEFDPIETTLDGVEEYVLDPVDTLTARELAQYAAAGAMGLGGMYGGYKYLTREGSKPIEKKTK